MLAMLLLLPAGEPTGIEFFEKKVRPLFHEQCSSCHGADPKKVRGGLRLDNAPYFEEFFPDAIVRPVQQAIAPEQEIWTQGTHKGAAAVLNLQHAQRGQLANGFAHGGAANRQRGAKF